jgi:hypothetical protein
MADPWVQALIDRLVKRAVHDITERLVGPVRSAKPRPKRVRPDRQRRTRPRAKSVQQHRRMPDLAPAPPVLVMVPPPVDLRADAVELVPKRKKGERRQGVRARSIAEIRPFRPLVDDEPDVDVSDLVRPRTRGECVDGPRPCPWVSCRHHLYLEVTEAGSLKLVHPDKQPEDLQPSCSLDVADKGPLTLDQVGATMNVTRERIRQLEGELLDELAGVMREQR